MRHGVCIALGLLLAGWAGAALADSRTDKFRRGDCEVERKYGDRGAYEEKVECKPDRRRSSSREFDGRREGKEEFRRGRCEVKREWKENGEYKEEVKCK
ncbi:MAG TPA: hypothetical protein VJ890_18315 [Vineibacter sp.]|nr:hypothetical protein [Vineibacter sp.]